MTAEQGGGQFHFNPDTYLDLMRAEVPAYDELQMQLVAATMGIRARRILDLGTGTGETARLVLEAHPRAKLVGVDSSPEMLERARAALPPARIEALITGRLEDPLPRGRFDLVVSALAIHHLNGLAKAQLFRRIAGALKPGGRFVLGDVVIPERPSDATTPLTPEFDRPDRIADQLRWMYEWGFSPRLAWLKGDLAVLAADRQIV